MVGGGYHKEEAPEKKTTKNRGKPSFYSVTVEEWVFFYMFFLQPHALRFWGREPEEPFLLYLRLNDPRTSQVVDPQDVNKTLP